MRTRLCPQSLLRGYWSHRHRGVFFANYVNFKGRSRRSEYWYMSLWLYLLSIILVLGMVLILSGYATGIQGNAATALGRTLGVGVGVILVAIVIYAFAIFLPSLTLLVRRYRDAGCPWWVLMIQYGVMGAGAVIWGYPSDAFNALSIISGLVTLVITLLPSRIPAGN
ncbi:DUF805 domain-containing protein [Lacticaseibacillus thailandensis]|uniref:DUF805 domain-containing protein n=1 Tax=Lacticaseibacillus thailandensis TaxID=381741 RepID=UPI00138F4244|nr:DUF805 domain-containing protein [Lacticaseibacillus thailandensis]